MKTEMKIKESTLKEKNPQKGKQRREGRNNGRKTGMIRSGMCAALLFLLALGGYAGSKPEAVSMTAAPVILNAEEERRIQGMSFEEIEKQQESSRRTEMEMLDGIIENENTDEATRSDALAQKLQLVGRMDTEMNIKTMLLHMGFEKTAVL
ncbi:MAG: SpoIIIAH-like family protein, partial [Clostridia bacterium]|nr:SpoIIIAH-like family protein [Clostridia bacterium]